MFGPLERVVLSLSGGKDSVAILLRLIETWADEDVYGVEIVYEDDPDGNDTDLCWGFIGMDSVMDHLAELADTGIEFEFPAYRMQPVKVDFNPYAKEAWEKRGRRK